MAGNALTPKQQRFVEEYLIDLNATAAYKRAGYRGIGRVAENNASRMLGNAGVAAAIQKGRERQRQRTEIDADRVLKEYAAVAFSDLGQILDFTNTDPVLRPTNAIPEEARRAVASIKVKRYTEGTPGQARQVEVTEFKLWSKTEALAKLAQHLGLLDAKKPLQIDVTTGGQPMAPAINIHDRIAELSDAFLRAARRELTGSPEPTSAEQDDEP